MQALDGLYCVGDSCFPGQGVIAVAFSGVMCAHRVAADIGKQGLKFSRLIVLVSSTKFYFKEDTYSVSGSCDGGG